MKGGKGCEEREVKECSVGFSRTGEHFSYKVDVFLPLFPPRSCLGDEHRGC